MHQPAIKNITPIQLSKCQRMKTPSLKTYLEV